MQTELFPDIIQRNDRFRRFSDYATRGFGIWSIAQHWRTLPNGERDQRTLVITYDDERYLRKKTHKQWAVVIRHYVGYTEIDTTGWGASKRSRPERKQRYRETEFPFATRSEATEFAERLAGTFESLNR